MDDASTITRPPLGGIRVRRQLRQFGYPNDPGNVFWDVAEARAFAGGDDCILVNDAPDMGRPYWDHTWVVQDAGQTTAYANCDLRQTLAYSEDECPALLKRRTARVLAAGGRLFHISATSTYLGRKYPASMEVQVLMDGSCRKLRLFTDHAQLFAHAHPTRTETIDLDYLVGTIRPFRGP